MGALKQQWVDRVEHEAVDPFQSWFDEELDEEKFFETDSRDRSFWVLVFLWGALTTSALASLALY